MWDLREIYLPKISRVRSPLLHRKPFLLSLSLSLSSLPPSFLIHSLARKHSKFTPTNYPSSSPCLSSIPCRACLPVKLCRAWAHSLTQNSLCPLMAKEERERERERRKMGWMRSRVNKFHPRSHALKAAIKYTCLPRFPGRQHQHQDFPHHSHQGWGEEDGKGYFPRQFDVIACRLTDNLKTKDRKGTKINWRRRNLRPPKSSSAEVENLWQWSVLSTFEYKAPFRGLVTWKLEDCLANNEIAKAKRLLRIHGRLILL